MAITILTIMIIMTRIIPSIIRTRRTQIIISLKEQESVYIPPTGRSHTYWWAGAIHIDDAGYKHVLPATHLKEDHKLNQSFAQEKTDKKELTDCLYASW